MLRTHNVVKSARFAGMIALVAVLTAVTARHLAMTKSQPAADEPVASSPEIVQLWFSQELEPAISRITLEGPSGPVEIGKTTAAEGDAHSMVATVSAPLADGTYAVGWRAAGDDGHPARGTFEFTVESTRQQQ